MTPEGKLLLERIQEIYPELSNSFQKIASYIMENYREMAFLTAAKLAEQVKVSESVVVRFASRIGYSGYPEMQQVAQDMIRAELSPMQRFDQQSKVVESSVFHAVMDRDRENIAKTEQNLTQEVIKEAAGTILSANHVWVVGLIESGSLARLFGLLMSYIIPNVTVVDHPGYEKALPMKRVGPEDVVIGFSFARYAKQTFQLLEYSKERNATIIAITDSRLSPIGRIASIPLVVAVDMISFFNSYTAVVMLMNMLLGEIVAQTPERVKSELKLLDDLARFDFM